MNFLTRGNSSGLDTSVRWWLIVRFAVFGSILSSAMLVYEMPFMEPSPYSVLLSVSLLSILVGLLLARFRVEKQADDGGEDDQQGGDGGLHSPPGELRPPAGDGIDPATGDHADQAGLAAQEEDYRQDGDKDAGHRQVWAAAA